MHHVPIVCPTIATVLLACLVGSSGLGSGAMAATPAAGATVPNISAATLLHRSLTIIQRQGYATHGSGEIDSNGCCPRSSAAARLVGDCVRDGPRSVSMRYAMRGTVIPQRTVVPIDSHFILKSSPRPARAWTRSPATHRRWKRDSTHTWELGLYVCPAVMAGEISQHFPARLVNLGAVTVRGIAAWHLQDRLPPTAGAVKGVVLQTDYYLERASLHWLRYAYVTSSGSPNRNGTGGQRLAMNYTPASASMRIGAPKVGSSTP